MRSEAIRAVGEMILAIGDAASKAHEEAMAVPSWRIFKHERAVSRAIALLNAHEIAVAKALELLNSSHGMPYSRIEGLEADTNERLSEEEMANGWHWCPEFDDLLMNKNDNECCCGLEDMLKDIKL